jgi:hypothetical protein
MRTRKKIKLLMMLIILGIWAVVYADVVKEPNANYGPC